MIEDMKIYRVYCNPEGMEELCSRSPFNLKKDLKHIRDEELKEICEEVANELKQGEDHPPIVSPMYWTPTRHTLYAKIRTMDVGRDAGKSNGYRCIALVDAKHQLAFILHIYRHGHGEDKTIDFKATKRLRALADEYEASMEAWMENR